MGGKKCVRTKSTLVKNSVLLVFVCVCLHVCKFVCIYWKKKETTWQFKTDTKIFASWSCETFLSSTMSGGKTHKRPSQEWVFKSSSVVMYINYSWLPITSEVYRSTSENDQRRICWATLCKGTASIEEETSTKHEDKRETTKNKLDLATQTRSSNTNTESRKHKHYI